MTLKYQANHDEVKKVEQPSLDLIISTIRNLNNEDRLFCILISESGNFVQCAGDSQYQIVEYQDVLNNDDIRHYQLEIPRKGWRKLLFGNEDVLETEHTIQIFTHFYQHGTVPSFYHQKDITKHVVRK